MKLKKKKIDSKFGIVLFSESYVADSIKFSRMYEENKEIISRQLTCQ